MMTVSEAIKIIKEIQKQTEPFLMILICVQETGGHYLTAMMKTEHTSHFPGRDIYKRALCQKCLIGCMSQTIDGHYENGKRYQA